MVSQIDTKIITKLAEILNKSNLTELEYENETVRISLARNSGSIAPVQPTVVPTPTLPTISEEKKENKDLQGEVEALIHDYHNDPNAVKSPMVGIVYLANSQSSPNFVNIGDDVKLGDTVCLIEAMKTFNPVKAHKSGRVTKILVEAGDPVEYGAPLIVIE